MFKTAELFNTQTTVTINHYCANTSAQNFRDPLTFIPDRWLDDPAFDGDKKDVVQPFSVGPRDCPGKRLVALPAPENSAALIINRFKYTTD